MNNSTSVKKNINKPMIITIIVAAVVLIAGSVGMILFRNSNHKKGDEAIQEVQDSYFTFLPEMTVGDLMYEYYGEDHWDYNADDVVEFWGTNQKDKSGLALHFDFVKADNTVDVTYRMYHEENETAHAISEEEFEEYILGLYAQLDVRYQNTTVTAQKETKQTTTTTTKTTTVTTTATTTTTTAATTTTKEEPRINSLDTPSIYTEARSVPIAICGMGEEVYDYTHAHSCDVVHWESIPNADGYEVSYVVHTGYLSEGTDQVYNEVKTVYENTFVYGNLTSHSETEYSSTELWHLAVRAFSVTDDGVIYSDWSNEVTAIWE